MTLRPLNGRILLRKPPVSEKIGSIIIPERARMLPQEGTVVAVSPSRIACPACRHVNEESSVRVGEQVLHGRFARMGLPGQGDDLYLVWANDIMCVLEPDDSHD